MSKEVRRRARCGNISLPNKQTNIKSVTMSKQNCDLEPLMNVSIHCLLTQKKSVRPDVYALHSTGLDPDSGIDSVKVELGIGINSSSKACPVIKIEINAAEPKAESASVSPMNDRFRSFFAFAHQVPVCFCTPYTDTSKGLFRVIVLPAHQ